MSVLAGHCRINAQNRHTLGSVEELQTGAMAPPRRFSEATPKRPETDLFLESVPEKLAPNPNFFVRLTANGESDSVPSLDHSEDSETSGELGEFGDSSNFHDVVHGASDADWLDRHPESTPCLILEPNWDLMEPPSPVLECLSLQKYAAPDTLYAQFPAWAGRKQRRKPKSLLRTPLIVQVTDGRHGDGIFPPQILPSGAPKQPNVTIWRRSDGGTVEPPLWAGLPSLPSFPSQLGRVLTDGEKCDIYGRRECSNSTAVALLASLCVFPPAWLLLSMGYFDRAAGVVPYWAKLIALTLGLGVFFAAIVVSVTLSVT